MITGLLCAGLYPFNFSPKNEVSWMPGGRGVRFNGYGEAQGYWDKGLFTGSSDQWPGVTLEFWVSCTRVADDVNDLLSLEARVESEPFAIVQSRNDLFVAGMMRESEGAQKFRHMSVDDTFQTGKSRFITVTTGANGTAIYLEGVEQKRNPGLQFVPQNFEGAVLLGQTARAHQEWYGNVRGLAIYRGVFTPDQIWERYNAWRQANWGELNAQGRDGALYAFDEGRGSVIRNRGTVGGDLRVPEKLRALHPVILSLPTIDDLKDASDIALNILGFVPFGMLVYLHLRLDGRPNAIAALVAVAAGFGISMVIEILQVLLPSRDSSLLDVINNTLGSAAGAWIAAVAWPSILGAVRRTVRSEIP